MEGLKRTLSKITNLRPYQIRLLNWTIYFSCGILLEIIFREILYDLGIEIIRILQNEIKQNLCLFYFFKIFSLLVSKEMLIIQIIFSYNFFDTYCGFIHTLTIVLSLILISIAKLIYKNPRPFFHEEWIIVYDNETGYGNPSGHSILGVSLILIYWKFLRLKNNYYYRNKKTVFFIIFTIIFLLGSSRLALGVHSLNQVILGSFMGYLIHLLIFNVMNVNLVIEEELHVLINQKFRKFYFVILSIIIFIALGIFNFFPLVMTDKEAKHMTQILKLFPDIPYSKTFDHDAFILLSAIGGILGSYLGIIFDIKVNLSNSVKLWLEFNKGEKRWNNTGIFTFKSLRRFSANLVLISVPLIFNLFIPSDANIYSIFILKNFLPYFFMIFLTTGLMRHLSFKLNCANENYKLV